MRPSFHLLAVLAVYTLTGCTQFMAHEDASSDTRSKFKKCTSENVATAEGKLLSERLWMEDASDGVEKLADANPLTAEEREALVKFHNKALQCRQIIITHAQKTSPAQAALFQDHGKRSDAIFSRLANGLIPVGLANRLSIESDRKLLIDLSNGHADTLGPQEAARQRETDELLEASDRLTAEAQAKSKTPMPTCTWLGNSLYCTNPHQS